MPQDSEVNDPTTGCDSGARNGSPRVGEARVGEKLKGRKVNNHGKIVTTHQVLGSAVQPRTKGRVETMAGADGRRELDVEAGLPQNPFRSARFGGVGAPNDDGRRKDARLAVTSSWRRQE
jgi:hypothetical protein